MKSRLKNALALLECTNLDVLASQFLTFSFTRSPFSALIVSLINRPENCLQSWSIKQSNEVEQGHLDVEISDADHPLIQLISRGESVLWENLNQGIHINDNRFRQFVAELPIGTGLYSLPLTDLRHKICGAIILFGKSLNTESYEQGIFPIYCALFHHQLKSLLELSLTQQKISHLQYLNSLQQDRERQLQAAVNMLTTSAPPVASHHFSDFREIDDLTVATERYEEQILKDRQQQANGDLDTMATSLNLSKRSLIYKLKKYGCMR
ncbi:TPA: Fis family transcriptional regulator [Providencia stuartii]|uniref:Fis family transcriptional regulator n=1 Tax=Providencia stuartii TaxID=588 RepID=UPI00097715EF|nr:Fis family transcriptional regulator [Providencia stuartii]UQZ12190.1 Fis family transcriptional regulator [Providencia stuartii]HEM8864882.1 Fis family transcriptional regulator [Providencia stuartii]